MKSSSYNKLPWLDGNFYSSLKLTNFVSEQHNFDLTSGT